MPLDLSFVRAQFPALSGDMIFMDNAGGSQCLSVVAERIRDYLLETNVQTGASYRTSQICSDRLAQARLAMAKMVNAQDPLEVLMGTNSSTSMKFLADAMASSVAEGDEIIVTSADHASHISPFLRLEDRGAVIKWWRFDEKTFELPLSGLEALLSERTRLVAMTHCSNILGSVNDVQGAAKLVHDAGAEIAVDGVAYAPHRRVDVQELDCDYYFLSLYKVFGPHQSVMFGKRGCLERLDNLYQYFMGKEHIPQKLEPGNCNYELAWGSIGIVDYLEQLGAGHADALAGAFAEIEAHEDRLGRQLVEGLQAMDGVRLIGPPPGANALGRVPTISFVHDRLSSPEIVGEVDPHSIGIRHGDFYARDVVEQLGLRSKGGVVRVSLAHYNTIEEIDRLLAALVPTLSN